MHCTGAFLIATCVNLFGIKDTDFFFAVAIIAVHAYTMLFLCAHSQFTVFSIFMVGESHRCGQIGNGLFLRYIPQISPTANFSQIPFICRSFEQLGIHYNLPHNKSLDNNASTSRTLIRITSILCLLSQPLKKRPLKNCRYPSYSPDMDD